MRSRLEDLIASAERQLASRSFDAAIDTYRTALGEGGATEAGVEARLESAYRARDAARGIVPAIEASAPPAVEAITEIQVTPRAVSEPAPSPPPLKSVVDQRPIEPPSFSLLQPEDYPIENREGEPYRMEVEKLSILNPTPLPESDLPDRMQMARILVACLIAAFVVVLAFCAR